MNLANLQISMVYASTMAIIYCIDQLMKISPSFIFFKSSTINLSKETSKFIGNKRKFNWKDCKCTIHINGKHSYSASLIHADLNEKKKDSLFICMKAIQYAQEKFLTILSNSSPPSTSSKTIYIFVLLAITWGVQKLFEHVNLSRMNSKSKITNSQSTE